VSLLGWSLGGTIAREVARQVPHRVRRVVIYGSPVIGGPTHTVGAGVLGVDETRRIAELASALDASDPVRVPVVSVFTRRDGVVDWRACLDHHSVHTTHVEVGTTHLGLGLDPDVWTAVARALAGHHDPGRRAGGLRARAHATAARGRHPTEEAS
jgi:pimeloyl-ACP methyl ester carboxylesterase